MNPNYKILSTMTDDWSIVKTYGGVNEDNVFGSLKEAKEYLINVSLVNQKMICEEEETMRCEVRELKMRDVKFEMNLTNTNR